MLINACMSTYTCHFCACYVRVWEREGEERERERERERLRLTSGVGGSSFWNVVAPMGGSSFLKQEKIQLQTHHVELENFLLLFPLIFTTEPAGTLMRPVRCVSVCVCVCVSDRVKEREKHYYYNI